MCSEWPFITPHVFTQAFARANNKVEFTARSVGHDDKNWVKIVHVCVNALLI